MKAEAFAFYKERKRYIEKHGMLNVGDGVVVGVSGGADSMCLLHVLWALQKEYGLRLAALHVNHGIRGAAADADEEFVRRECETLGVPFCAVHEDVPALAAQWGLTPEEAGRRARYRAFHSAAEALGYKKIAVAHNENDNAETFLFQALRGSGIWGLAGIAPCRMEEGHTIIRPLLSVSRARIEAFLALEGHAFCTDMTNLAPDYARNRIRNELLPKAEEQINSGAVGHLAQAATQMYEIREFLEKYVKEEYQKTAKEIKENAGCRRVCLEIPVWEQQPVFLQREVALYALGRAAGSRRDISRAHVEALCGLMRLQTGRRIELPHGLCAIRRYNQVQIAQREGDAGSGALARFVRAGAENKADADREALIRPAPTEPESAAQYREFPQMPPECVLRADHFPQTFSLGGYELSLRRIAGGLAEYRAQCGEGNEKNSLNEKNCYAKCFDYGKIGNILVLRTKRPGDYILINGGRNKKGLKALFTDGKVPVEYRGGLPLLAAGSHVLWAVGVRNSEGFLVTENTKQILVVELRKRGQELQWQKKSV